MALLVINCLHLLNENRIDVFVSRAVLKELRSVLNYPPVRQKLPNLDDETIQMFVGHLLFRGTFLRNVPHVFDHPRARQDEPYIDLAAAANADFLISRDKNLLDLATDHSTVGKQFRQQFPALSIINPVVFLSQIAAS